MIYLIPTHLGNTDSHLLPKQINDVIEQCDILFAENLKTTRHFLKTLQVAKKIDDFEWHELNKDTALPELQTYIKLIGKRTAGIISEAGVPAIADPGAALVKLAHKQNIKVVPLTGPSSILLALMASGFNGQSFTFHGYLPIEAADRIKKIKQLEQAARDGAAQIFIETPYRNNALLNDMLLSCRAETKLCIACNITLPDEFIYTKNIETWQKAPPDLHKRPAVFLIG